SRFRDGERIAYNLFETLQVFGVADEISYDIFYAAFEIALNVRHSGWFRQATINISVKHSPCVQNGIEVELQYRDYGRGLKHIHETIMKALDKQSPQRGWKYIFNTIKDYTNRITIKSNREEIIYEDSPNNYKSTQSRDFHKGMAIALHAMVPGTSIPVASISPPFGDTLSFGLKDERRKGQKATLEKGSSSPVGGKIQQIIKKALLWWQEIKDFTLITGDPSVDKHLRDMAAEQEELEHRINYSKLKRITADIIAAEPRVGEFMRNSGLTIDIVDSHSGQTVGRLRKTVFSAAPAVKVYVGEGHRYADILREARGGIHQAMVWYTYPPVGRVVRYLFLQLNLTVLLVQLALIYFLVNDLKIPSLMLLLVCFVFSFSWSWVHFQERQIYRDGLAYGQKLLQNKGYQPVEVIDLRNDSPPSEDPLLDKLEKKYPSQGEAGQDDGRTGSQLNSSPLTNKGNGSISPNNNTDASSPAISPLLSPLRSYKYRNPGLRNWRLDDLLRYYPVMEFIKHLKLDDPLILEIGMGYKGGIGLYSENRMRIIGVDLFERQKIDCARYFNNIIQLVKADASLLPFTESSMDIVVSLDMLEHMAREERPRALAAMFNVVREGGYLILGVPVGAKSRKAEESLNRAWKLISGKTNIWLDEHKQYGLPEEEEIGQILNNLGLSRLNRYGRAMEADNRMGEAAYYQQDNVCIYLWPILLFLSVISARIFPYISRNIFISLLPALTSLNSPGYRQIYFVRKSQVKMHRYKSASPLPNERGSSSSLQAWRWLRSLRNRFSSIPSWPVDREYNPQRIIELPCLYGNDIKLYQCNGVSVFSFADHNLLYGLLTE
ncbi:MAG: class I SAM-dependent methyltransferase, partial [Candidatus Omnitrophota bacterium]